jgi:hypothetical protein
MCPRLADGPQLCDDCVDNVNERRVRAVLALTKCFLSFEKVIAELCSSRIRIALFLPACNHEGPTLRDEMCNSGTTGSARETTSCPFSNRAFRQPKS